VNLPKITSLNYSARIFVFLFGLGAVAWGGFVLPIFKQQMPLHRVANELLKGRNFDLRKLITERQRVLAARSKICNPTALRDAVVVGRTIVVGSIPIGQIATDSEAGLLEGSVRSAVACAPTDAFAWLALFWLDTAAHGVTPQNTRYLEMSYNAGPNEGWIAYWRVQVALTYFEHLPPDLSDKVAADFVKLLDTQVLYNEAAGILAQLPDATKSRLADAVKNAKPDSRQTFARVLSDTGVNVAIPNTQLPTVPLWER
jgi:hypothetical protein